MGQARPKEGGKEVKKKPQIIWDWLPIVGKPENMRTVSRWVCTTCGLEQFQVLRPGLNSKTPQPPSSIDDHDAFKSKGCTCGGRFIYVKDSWRIETLQEVK
jgi:hypothetical protein